MTQSLTGDWTRDLPHSMPALGYRGGGSVSSDWYGFCFILFQTPEQTPAEPKLGAKEMADLELELELDLENLDVNDVAVSI